MLHARLGKVQRRVIELQPAGQRDMDKVGDRFLFRGRRRKPSLEHAPFLHITDTKAMGITRLTVDPLDEFRVNNLFPQNPRPGNGTFYGAGKGGRLPCRNGFPLAVIRALHLGKIISFVLITQPRDAVWTACPEVTVT